MRLEPRKIRGVYKQKFHKDMEFSDWKIYLNEKSRMVLMELRKQEGLITWHTNPLNPNIKEEIVFKDKNEWNTFDVSRRKALTIQKYLYPLKHKQQLKDSNVELENICE